MRRISITCVALCFLFSTIAHAAGRNRDDGELARDPAAPLHATVWAAYERFASFNRAAFVKNGFDEAVAADLAMRFEIRFLGHGTIDSIRHVPWADLVTLPAGDVIDGRRMYESAHGYRQLAYPAYWKAGEWNTWLDPAMTVGYVLAVESSALHDVSTYVAYEATVHFEGRTRTYRAMAVLHDRYDRTGRIEFIDNVVGRSGAVTRLWHDEARPFEGYPFVEASGEVTLRALPHRAQDRPAGPGIRSNSAPGYKYKRWPEELSRGTTDHVSGAHGAKGDLIVLCTAADTQNEHFCIASSSVAEYEVGPKLSATTPLPWHHDPEVASDGNSSGATFSSPVGCTAAAAYNVRLCPIYCGTTLSVTVGPGGAGASVSISFDPEAEDKVSDKFSHECSPVPSNANVCPEGGTVPADQFQVVGIDSPSDCESASPVILDMAGDGIALTDFADGVFFDLDSNGRPEQLSWTAAGADDAFVAYDRNGDGAITSGRELFGNYTWQDPSAAPNGFLALAKYDLPENGGNGDGAIDAGDERFSKFVLWRDADHDGVSTPDELQPLHASGVRAIALDYKESRRTDEHGNRFRYRTRMTSSKDSDAAKWAWDVFFVTR